MPRPPPGGRPLPSPRNASVPREYPGHSRRISSAGTVRLHASGTSSTAKHCPTAPSAGFRRLLDSNLVRKLARRHDARAKIYCSASRLTPGLARVTFRVS